MKPCLLPSALLAAALLVSPGLAQVHASESPAFKVPEQNAEPMDRGTTAAPVILPALANVLAQSRVFHTSELPARTAANGSQSRPIAHGTLRTGEPVGLHQSMQPAGAAAVPLHVIRHSELICVQSGQIDFDQQDPSGALAIEHAGAGDIIYVAEGTNHRIRNGGSTPATYTVIAIGGDAK